MDTPSKNAIRIVLIDDHQSVLWGLEKLIQSQEPEMKVVGKFTSYSAAAPHLKSLLANIILLDLDLGVENGLDAIPQIIKSTTAKVLVLTGSRDVKLHDKAIVSGAKGVLSKENSAEVILSAISQVNAGKIWIDYDRISDVISELANSKKVDEEVKVENNKINSLTQRERSIVMAMTDNAGATGAAIANVLHIEESTLRNHLTSIYSKLGVSSRLELWEYANKHGLTRRTNTPNS